MLIAKDIDRVKGIVETFRHPEAPEVRVEGSDVDDVVDSSYERLVKMLRTFKGISEGEYRAAMRTCVRFECMDHCREAMGHDMRRAGSLDERTKDDEGDERGRFDRDIAEQEKERVAEEEALTAGREQALLRQERVRTAIADLKNANRRRVVELTYAGASTEKIMAELDTTRDNVYQLRRRGLKDLGDILDGNHSDDGQP